MQLEVVQDPQHRPMAQDETLYDVPRNLVSLLETGEFVLFLGAGIGLDAGLPGWKNSLREIADRLRSYAPQYAQLMTDETEAGRFLQSAELLYLAPITVDDRTRILREVFDKQPRITRRLRLLTLTRCQGIVTTNFDRSLEIAAAQAQAPLGPVYISESRS